MIVLLTSLWLGSGGQVEPITGSAGATPEGEKTMAKPSSDREQVAQLVLDLDDLQPYYHVEDVPGRRPLVVRSTKAVQDHPALSKFGAPVRYEEAPGDAPFFEFTRLDLAGDTADVEFRYPVEGIAGEAHLTKAGGSWKVESHSLTER